MGMAETLGIARGYLDHIDRELARCDPETAIGIAEQAQVLQILINQASRLEMEIVGKFVELKSIVRHAQKNRRPIPC